MGNNETGQPILAGCWKTQFFGSARRLDFGHWAAHKLESLTGHGLRHGEAVAIGMALDARYSVEAGLLPAAQAEHLSALLERPGFRLWDAALERRDGDGRALAMQDLAEFRELSIHYGGNQPVKRRHAERFVVPALRRRPGQASAGVAQAA